MIQNITKELLLKQFGNLSTNEIVKQLHKFMYIKDDFLEKLANEALHENWWDNYYVLEKYLAIQIPWSIEQWLFSIGDNQWYISAGNLQTRYWTPLYLVIEQNGSSNNSIPWYLKTAGANVMAPVWLPGTPKIPEWSDLQKWLEIVIMHEHILGENADRVPFLKDTPPIAQMCAISWAIQWSLNRKLQLPYWYFWKMQYLVPLYLQSRENITEAPDLVAPIEVDINGTLRVRTVLSPYMPYPNARASVYRHDELPSWFLNWWSDSYSNMIINT